MKVVHLSTYYNKGGAAKAHFRIHNQLKQLGVDSQFLVRNSNGSHFEDVQLLNPKKSRLSRLIERNRSKSLSKELDCYPQRLLPGKELFSDDRTSDKHGFVRQLKDADIVQLNWVAGFIDYQSFFKNVNSSRSKVVWRLADMNPFTGGCHFSEGCQKFEKSCGSCPTLGSDNDRDLSFEILRRKVEAMNRLAEEKLTIVCVSDWMMDNVRRSRVFRKFECKKITTGVNVELFRPRDKALLRKKHGIAVDKKVVLFVADRGHIRRRKGWNYVSDICEKLQTQPTVLTVLIGTDECNLSEADKALVLHTGEIGSPKTIAEFYALADAFVYTGIDDNLPNTVLEAMASGLVVFSFNTGGVPDVVEDGINGYLFTKGDVGALASKLKDFLVVEDQDSSISLNARHRIVESFSAESEGRSYLELYQTLLGTG